MARRLHTAPLTMGRPRVEGFVSAERWSQDLAPIEIK
jgi:hypothetical protein